MRRSVPFVGEKKIARAASPAGEAKRSAGQIIDEVVSTDSGESSWDDLVPSELTKPKSESPKASGSISLPEAKKTTAKAPSVAGSSSKSISRAAATSSSTIVYADAPSVEWVLINSGRGVRVNIHGSVDASIRSEWNRLLDETQATGASEYEFNLAETPGLSLTGLGMLLLFRERKASALQGIKLCNCNKDVAQLLKWTGMDKYFEIQLKN